jgi:hypothetical protein
VIKYDNEGIATAIPIVEDIREYIRKPIESFNEPGEEIYICIEHFKQYQSEILKAFKREEDALAFQRYYQLNNFRKCDIIKIILE